MNFQIKRALKISAYSALTLIVLYSILVALAFSTPIVMNAYTDALVKYGNIDQSTIDVQTYTKEEFAKEFLNAPLGKESDLIELFESEYGTENKQVGILLVSYDIPDPDKPENRIYIGINKYTDFAFSYSTQVYFDEINATEQI
ncbi:hypothetical protein V7O67_05230 [Methanolobus sp. ZRKC4]|uniref:hypothetical protein n=1 Tax=Methanolobus sp. ZRKC4 TaxID=3125787 RepID=UPI003246B9F3